MSNNNTYLFTFQMKQDGELSFLGDHGAFLDGQILIKPIPSDSKVNVFIIAVTITNEETNTAKIEFAKAMSYPLTKEGRPLFCDYEAKVISLSDVEKITYTKKAASILSKSQYS